MMKIIRTTGWSEEGINMWLGKIWANELIPGENKFGKET